MMRACILWVNSARLARLKVLNLIDCAIGEWMIEHALLDIYVCILAWRDVRRCHCRNMIGQRIFHCFLKDALGTIMHLV